MGDKSQFKNSETKTLALVVFLTQSYHVNILNKSRRCKYRYIGSNKLELIGLFKIKRN